MSDSNRRVERGIGSGGDQVRISLFDDFHLTSRFGSLALPPRRHSQRLLAFLLLATPNLWLEREEICRELWPEEDLHSALPRLRLALHGLAHSLPERVDGEEWVDRDGQRLKWSADAPCQVDVWEMERVVDGGRYGCGGVRGALPLSSMYGPEGSSLGSLASLPGASSAAKRRARVAALRLAIASYTGPLLPAFDDPWLALHRSRCEFLFRSACFELIDQLVALNAPFDALVAARRIVLHDPTDEAAHTAVIRLLAARGDRAAALDRLEKCVCDLQAAGLTPSESLDALAADIRGGRFVPTGRPEKCSVAVHSAPLNDGVALVDDSGRVDALVGRLTRGRLVTVVGVCGIGKSRMLREGSRAAMPEWSASGMRPWLVDGDDLDADGVAAASDEPIGMLAILADHVAAAIGAPPVALADAAFRSVVDVLRQVPTVLVIDHADAPRKAWPRFVHDLLAHCPQLRVVCAARQPLGIRGEIVWRVPPLRTCPSRRATRGAPSEAVALYTAFGGRWPAPLPDREPAATAVDEWIAEADGLPVAAALLARASHVVGPPPDPALRAALWSLSLGAGVAVSGAKMGRPMLPYDPPTAAVAARHASLSSAYAHTLLDLGPIARQMLGILATTAPPLNPATVQAAWKARADVASLVQEDDVDDEDNEDSDLAARAPRDANRPNFRRGIDDGTWLEALITLAQCGLIDVQRSEGQPTTYIVRPGLRRYLLDGA